MSITTDVLMTKLQDIFFERNIYKAALQKIQSRKAGDTQEIIADYVGLTLNRRRKGAPALSAKANTAEIDP